MTTQRLRGLVSGVLVVGVSIATALIAAAMIGSLIVGWQGSLRGAASPSESMSDFAKMPSGLLMLRPIAIAQLGLLVLLATPVLRVGMSFAAFAIEGDTLYAAIALAVLGVLLMSLFVLR